MSTVVDPRCEQPPVVGGGPAYSRKKETIPRSLRSSGGNVTGLPPGARPGEVRLLGRTRRRVPVTAETRRSPLSAVAVAVAAVFLAFSCGGGGSPASSTPATPIPTPSPTPTPGGVGQTCRLGYGDPNAQCVDTKSGSQLVDYVLTAMDDLATQQPQLFNVKDEAGIGTGNYKIVDVEGYLNGMVARLQSYGLCAQRDPGDYLYQQINVKNTNDLSEDFHVLTSAGYVWHNAGAFKTVCTPASFPLNYAAIDIPPPGSGCGRPYPPPIHHFNSKIHIPGQDYDTLDSTPIVRDGEYCAAIGYTDGRFDCPVRQEQSPERKACETWRVGYAKDNGQPGPTWTLNGHYCTGPESGCANFPGNQYELYAYKGGTYVMCGQSGACGELIGTRAP